MTTTGLPDIWPEALREETKARFFSLGFMRPSHLREEVGETRFAEKSRCAGKSQQRRWRTSIARQEIVDENVRDVRIQDGHDGTRGIYRMHGVKIGEGIWTNRVECARRLEAL